MADSGTAVLVEFSPPTERSPVGKLIVLLTCGAAAATMEKTLAVGKRVSGYIVGASFKAGATAPTDASDLDVFDANPLLDGDSMNAAMITAAVDGLNLIDSTYTYKVFATKYPVDTGHLRFRWSNNIVNNALGKLCLYVARNIVS